ncbi:MAG TPA: aminotransferase class III-fold pyridoxal phosphate-dependent enzyme, partial [Longimicrobiaceae bacterium]|nr:aminotransferase class III-fold pyridoxal phosphate-dependent enzyme [Longimicrobiaceae bacterium]
MPELTTAPVRMPPFDHTPRPYTGPSREEVLAMRREFCNPALFTLYREPLLIVEGKMQYLFDETGRRYLDMFAGIVTVSCGHCHPRVVARIQEQVGT